MKLKVSVEVREEILDIYESGKATQAELARNHGITSALISKWVSIYRPHLIRKRRDFTSLEYLKVEKMRRRGEKIEVIARVLGTSPGSVWYILKRIDPSLCGPSRRRRPHSWTSKVDVREFTRDWKSGMTVAGMRAKFDISRSGVDRLRKKLGLNSRNGEGLGSRVKRGVVDTQIKRILLARQMGMSYKDMSAKFHVSGSDLSRLFRAHGIMIKGREKKVWPQALKDRARLLLRGPMTYRAIGRAVGVPWVTVRGWCQKWGMTRKKKPSPAMRALMRRIDEAIDYVPIEERA